MSAAVGILVGYDGSRGSERALSWAVQEARRRSARLTVCHAWCTGDGPAAAAGLAAAARSLGSGVLDQGVAVAAAALGPGRVTPLLAEGPAAAVLCALSGRAGLVVVGARGRGAQPDGGSIPGLLTGSVSGQVAAYASGPVVVERGHWCAADGAAPGDVVTGTDGSPDSRAALQFAAAEAALRAVPLRVVCALADSPGCLGGEGQLGQAVDELLTGLAKDQPDVTIMRRVVRSAPLGILLAEARDAQLLVMGRRGLGGVRGTRLGSVGQGVLDHAPCPVAITGCQSPATANPTAPTTKESS